MTVQGTGGGPSKKNGKLGEEGSCLPCRVTQKQRLGNRPKAGQAVPVTAQAATSKDRRRQPDRRCVPAAVLFIVKKQPVKKPGDRHQGAGPRAGQAVRDLMKKFWKGEGDRPKAAAGRARYDTAAMAKDRRGQRDRRCLLLFYQ